MDGQYYPPPGGPSGMAPIHEHQEPHDHDDCASQCGDTGDAVCCDNDACAPNAFEAFCDFEGCQHNAVCDDQACPSMLPCHDDGCVDQVALCQDETCLAASHPCTDTNCNYIAIPCEHGDTPAGHSQHAAPQQFLHHQHNTHYGGQHYGFQQNHLQHNHFPHNEFQDNGLHHQDLQQPGVSQPTTILQPFGESSGLEDVNFEQNDSSATIMMGYLGSLNLPSHGNTFLPTDLPLGPTQAASWPYTQQLSDVDQTVYGDSGNFSIPSSSMPATPRSTFSVSRSISATPASLSSAAPSSINPDSGSSQSTIGPDAAGPSRPPGHVCQWRSDPRSDQICGEVFGTAQEVHNHCKAAHIQSLTRDSRGFCCQWHGCQRGAPFAQKSKLERHLQKHTGFKPVVCPVCGQSFSARQSLAQHLRTHTGEKPWKCTYPDCTRAFKQQSALTMHMRTHTGIKPLRCEICGKRFGESSNLSKHRKTHNSEGEHRCEDCGRHFHRQDQLRRHSRIHEKKKLQVLQTLAESTAASQSLI